MTEANKFVTSHDKFFHLVTLHLCNFKKAEVWGGGWGTKTTPMCLEATYSQRVLVRR